MNRLLIGTAVTVLLGLSPALAADDCKRASDAAWRVAGNLEAGASAVIRQRRHFGRRGRAELGASVVGCGERHQAERRRDEP